MKIKYGILVLLLFQFTFSGKTLSQIFKKENTFPLTIPFIKIFDKDTTYKSTWKMRAIPPRYGSRIDKYIYKLIVTITVPGGMIWSEPFALLYNIPGLESGFIIVNEERYDILPDRFNELIVEIRTKHHGWAKFELAAFDELTGEVHIPDNDFPLRRKDFLLE
jgi:hypothetical protein